MMNDLNNLNDARICELNARIRELEDSLRKMCNVAHKRDSWETFPPEVLDEALTVLGDKL